MQSSSDKLPVSVFVVCFNEEQNIRRLLDSCSDMDEIVIVDSGSTDKTLEIAREYTDHIVINEWPGYAKQKAFAMSLCRNKWVLNLDADEELLPELVDQFRDVIKQDRYTSVRCARNDVFIGEVLSRFTRKANNCRLYKKDKAQFDITRLVHESADIEGEQLRIKEAFNHYGYNDIDPCIMKNNEYSSLKAKEKFEKGRLFSVVKLFLIFPLVFFKAFILHGYIFSGIRGFIQATNIAHYAFLKEAKLYEHWQNKDRH